MQETESITNVLIEKANEKERQSENLDRAINEKHSGLNKEKRKRASERCCRLVYRKIEILESEIDDLHTEISTHEETIERLQDKIQTIQNDHSRELM